MTKATNHAITAEQAVARYEAALPELGAPTRWPARRSRRRSGQPDHTGRPAAPGPGVGPKDGTLSRVDGKAVAGEERAQAWGQGPTERR